MPYYQPTGVDDVASKTAGATSIAVDAARQALVGTEAGNIVVEVRADTDTLARAEARDVDLDRRRWSICTLRVDEDTYAVALEVRVGAEVYATGGRSASVLSTTVSSERMSTTGEGR